MTDKNKSEEEAKISQNEIEEDIKIEELDKTNQPINAKEKDSNENIDLNNKGKKDSKNESKSSEKENEKLDKNKKKDKDLDSNKNNEIARIKIQEDKSDDNMDQKSKPEQNEKLKENCISSTSYGAYYNSTQNLKNLKKFKQDLQVNNDNYNNFSAIFDQMDKEEIKLTEIYKDEKIVNKEIIEKNAILDDDIFENLIRKILHDTYDLKEYLCYPYFTVEYCSKKSSNMVKLYYHKIYIECNEGLPDKNNMESDNKNNIEISINISHSKQSKKKKKKELKNKNAEKFYCLDDRETYMILYNKKIPMIFQKNNNSFYSANIISNNFESSTEFLFKKDNQDFITSFIMADITKELSEVKGEMTRTKNKLDSLKGDDKEKKMLKEKLIILNKMYDFLKNKYSKKNIEESLKKKREELAYFEERIKFENLMQKSGNQNKKEYEKEKQKIKKEIENYEMLLKVITIRIERKDQEFDGLFFSSKEIKLENGCGDTLSIPPDKPIIIEVKNNSKYNEIINNIREKKTILDSVRLNEKNFYFIGILRDININEKTNVDQNKERKNMYFGNMIILYPEKSKFLGVPLYEERKKKEIKTGKDLEDIINLFMTKLDYLNNKIDKIDKLEKDIEDLKKNQQKANEGEK